MVFTNCITEMDFDRDDACDTGLALGLGCREKMERQEGQFRSFSVTPMTDGQSRSNHQSYNPLISFEGLPPVTEETSLSLRLFEANCRPLKKAEVEELAEEAQQSSPLSVVSSFSNTNHDSLQGCFKRERDQESDHGELGTTHEEAARRRKKLRLTKEQSVFLEESFKEHNTLNPKHKQALAKKLNLRPRQVEVWFQNRRARTKLKQTEVDCDFLKRWCEKLAEENRRLKKELQQLKDLKFSSPFCIQLPAAVAATLTVCPSCSNIGGALDEENAAKHYAFFTNPSAAC